MNFGYLGAPTTTRRDSIGGHGPICNECKTHTISLLNLLIENIILEIFQCTHEVTMKSTPISVKKRKEVFEMKSLDFGLMDFNLVDESLGSGTSTSKILDLLAKRKVDDVVLEPVKKVVAKEIKKVEKKEERYSIDWDDEIVDIADYSHEDGLLSQYLSKDACDNNEYTKFSKTTSTKEDEDYEIAPFFLKFHETLSLNPSSMIRAHKHPLLYSDTSTRCICGLDGRFIIQLLPSYFLHFDLKLDWITVLVFKCCDYYLIIQNE